jgi:hypothetical protein
MKEGTGSQKIPRGSGMDVKPLVEVWFDYI